MVSRRFDKKLEKKSATPKEQRTRTENWNRLKHLVDLKCGMLSK